MFSAESGSFEVPKSIPQRRVPPYSVRQNWPRKDVLGVETPFWGFSTKLTWYRGEGGYSIYGQIP